MISHATKEQILDNLDVRAILTDLGIQFEERGHGDLWAPCPLPGHEEKTPSFKISARYGHWHCFGCRRQQGDLDGGIVTLVAVVRDMRSRFAVDDKGEAILDREKAWAWLAEHAGVASDPVEQIRRGTASPRRWEAKIPDPVFPPRLTMPAECELPETSPEAMEYLAMRGLTEAEVWRYGIRWWAERRRVVIPTMTDGELSNFDARTIDLRCPKCRRTSPAARCPRNPVGRKICPNVRCSHPMDDVRPKTFGASTEDGARPDRSIGGYDLVPRRAELLLVTEGPFDAWHLMREQKIPAVFTRGSTIHERQMRLLARWPRIVFVPDGDAAGRSVEGQVAAMAALVRDPRIPLREVRVAILPDGMQPDGLPTDEMRSLIEAARVPRVGSRPTCSPAQILPK